MPAAQQKRIIAERRKLLAAKTAAKEPPGKTKSKRPAKKP
jgi:hypothetical protein